MRLAVTIPYRGGDRHRDRNHKHVRRHLETTLGLPVADIDTDHEQFNRAAARNACVRHAQALDADVVLICDADVLVHPAAVHLAAANAAHGERLNLPFDNYRALTWPATKMLTAGICTDPARLPCEWTQADSSGGAIVITPDAWWAAGGMDEGFTGWGFEDTAFWHATTTLLGPAVRHPGTLVHLWHASAMDQESLEYAVNRERCAIYEAAHENPEAMRRLVDGLRPRGSAGN